MHTIALVFAFAIGLALIAFSLYQRANRPTYDGSTLVIGTLAPYQPEPQVKRRSNGTFAKGSQPIGVVRGPGGKFVSAS